MVRARLDLPFGMLVRMVLFLSDHAPKAATVWIAKGYYCKYCLYRTE